MKAIFPWVDDAKFQNLAATHLQENLSIDGFTFCGWWNIVLKPSALLQRDFVGMIVQMRKIADCSTLSSTEENLTVLFHLLQVHAIARHDSPYQTRLSELREHVPGGMRLQLHGCTRSERGHLEDIRNRNGNLRNLIPLKLAVMCIRQGSEALSSRQTLAYTSASFSTSFFVHVMLRWPL